MHGHGPSLSNRPPTTASSTYAESSKEYKAVSAPKIQVGNSKPSNMRLKLNKPASMGGMQQ